MRHSSIIIQNTYLCTSPNGGIHICESVFRQPAPKIWTIFAYKAMGSVVDTPPVSMIMQSVGFPHLYSISSGCGVRLFLFALRLSRTFGGSYENGSTLLYFLLYSAWGPQYERGHEAIHCYLHFDRWSINNANRH